jgi:hypothetical protein
MAKMGRPNEVDKKINKEELEKLLKLYPTLQDVCDWFDVSERGLQRYVKKHYSKTFDDLRDKMWIRTKTAIKRVQIDKALKGDNTMLIWVGKNMLGQSDKLEGFGDLNSSPKITLNYNLNDKAGS